MGEEHQLALQLERRARHLLEDGATVLGAHLHLVAA
jgi:hypothetical protein